MNPDLWQDERIRYVIERLAPYAADFEPGGPLLSARIDITLADGRTHSHLQRGFRGHPDNAGRADAVVHKFTTITTGILDPTDSTRLVRVVDTLDDQPNLDELVRCLVATTSNTGNE
ncbi:hypothetical protein AB0F91_38245 [Amycolatopsis sp. NPDC023774]|uniref:hypothetical protein n=1 Tax=Amycolatopsis sp. NPDC023774 TaxID=3155015 RepID=UPI0033EE6BD7